MEPSPQQVPPDAQRSEDGHYWWDTTANEWKPVAGAQGDADPREKARADAGLPPEKHAATDEQRAQYIGESTIGHESLAYSELEVPEISEHEAGEHEGEQTS